MTLSEIQQNLKDLSVKDIGNALETLRTITKGKNLYNMVIMKQGSYNGLERDQKQGTISRENANLQMNQLRYQFTAIVDDIEEDDIIMDKAAQVLLTSKGVSSNSTTADAGNENASTTSSGIYISYAWGGDREKIVDKLEEELKEKGVSIIRDKKALGYKGSIVEFMKDIGKGNKIIVVISKKYLESENCMFELTQIYENKDFAKRIFPIVLEDANIYSPLGRVKYIKYWDGKIAELDEALKSVGTGLNMSELQQELNNYGDIRASFDKMAFVLKDMNALTPEIHQNQDFQSLYEQLTA